MTDAEGRVRTHRARLVIHEDRFYGACICGWKIGPLLTAMQVYAACRDHDGRD